jgi:hypothetical protein
MGGQAIRQIRAAPKGGVSCGILPAHVRPATANIVTTMKTLASPPPLARIALCMLAVFAAAGVRAQAQAPLPAPPKHNCEKAEYPGRLATDRRIKQFNVELEAYKACLQKFASEQKAISQIHVDAANNAINEYNDYIKELNKLFDRDPKEDKK